MRKHFVPTHRITFQPFDGPLEATLVMQLKGEVWTQGEWDGLAPGQDWSHEHE